MELKDTIEMMNSPDYKERFKAEYVQTNIRLEKLDAMLSKYKEGTLDFTPKCSYHLLKEQSRVMTEYCAILEVRAQIEGIEL